MYLLLFQQKRLRQHLYLCFLAGLLILFNVQLVLSLHFRLTVMLLQPHLMLSLIELPL